jgi:excisionase family DNA binding protein
MNIELPDAVLEEIAQRAAEIVLANQPSGNGSEPSPYLTIPEAAELLRARRHRVDDLLSRGTLTRIKDGTRTLIARAEIEDYLIGKPTGRGRR